MALPGLALRVSLRSAEPAGPAAQQLGYSAAAAAAGAKNPAKIKDPPRPVSMAGLLSASSI